MKSATILSLVSSAALAVAAPAANAPYKYVWTISVDGMHGSDVDKYTAVRPNSVIGKLLSTGIQYTDCYTSGPSDSFPGTIAQYTGGKPHTTGIWYDDVWDATYYPAGSNCKGAPGAEVAYDESIDYNSSLLFSGGIDPKKLPLNGQCQPVYPHNRLLVNTVFNVIHNAGLQTAYVDKHPSYDIVTGPSGDGLTVGYFPEIAAVGGSLNATIAYDQLHVNAWLEMIDGVTPVNSTYGKLTPGQMPSIIGGNFQSLSVAQKTIGYNANLTLSAGELQALDFIDASLGNITAKLAAKGYLKDTLFIIASKHGQAPINQALLRKIDPQALMNATGVPTAFITTDDIGLIWLNKTSDIPTAVRNIQAKAASLGIQELIYGQGLIDQGFATAATLNSPRTPMIIVRVNLGVIYTTSKTKLAEHGGLSYDDRVVACIASNPSLAKAVVSDRVNTTQVAPTALQALGLDPNQLMAVQMEGTQSLKGIFPAEQAWGPWKTW